MIIKKVVYLSLLSAFMLTGCYGVRKAPAESSCADGSCLVKVDNQPPAPAVAQSADEGYINYTDVAADYKAYGERSVTDHRVGTSGVASNLSSSIPPVIEDEMFSYEEELGVSASGAKEVSVSETVEADYVSAEDPVEDWLAEEGVSLKDLLTEWSEKSGWRLIWKSNRNYTLNAGAMFRARFADAASALIRAFARATPAPIATFYKGNRVLVIETMEDENAYE